MCPIIVVDNVPPKARGVLAREGVQYISVRDRQLHAPVLGLILSDQQDLPFTRKIYEPRLFHGTALAWMAFLLLRKAETPTDLNFTEWKNLLDKEQIEVRSHPFSMGALHSAVEQMEYFNVLQKSPKGRSTLLMFESRDNIWKKLIKHCPEVVARRVEIEMDPFFDDDFSAFTKISGVSALSELTQLSEANERVRMMRSVHYSLFRKKISKLNRTVLTSPIQVEICEFPFDFPKNKTNRNFVNEIILALSTRNDPDARVRIAASEMMSHLGLNGELLWSNNG